MPDGIALPGRLRDKLTYSAAAGTLTYRGFMTKCTYDELSALSDDADYHRALETLFVLTSAEVAEPRAGRRLVPALAASMLGLAALVALLLWITTRHSTAGDSSRASDNVTVSAAR